MSLKKSCAKKWVVNSGESIVQNNKSEMTLFHLKFKAKTLSFPISEIVGKLTYHRHNKQTILNEQTSPSGRVKEKH